jgi:hypothetical protein
LEPLQHLHQLPFEDVAFGNLLLDRAQLLRYKCLEAGPRCLACPALQFRRQGFEMGEREP